MGKERSWRPGEPEYVFHLSIEKILLLAAAAAKSRHGERDELLVLLLFDGCLRCSEALAVTPGDVQAELGGWVVKIASGKGGKFNRVAISQSLAAKMQSYARRLQMRPGARFFPVSRPRAFQIIAEAFERADVPRPSRDRDRVGTVHILRHSGAIERLRKTRNPKAVQDQLRHKSPAMTLRYMKTLSHDESMAIQQEVDFGW